MHARLRHYQDEVDDTLRGLIATRGGPALALMRYQLGHTDASGAEATGQGGKLLRPLLCLLTCEALKGDRHRAIPAAAAVELLHNFTLVHDDIQDESPMRRGRASVWKVWGRAQAINAGDGIYALSHLALLGLRERGATAEATLEATRILDEACLSMCSGQSQDLADAASAPDAKRYLETIEGKTGALMACAMQLGALAAEADAEVQRVCARAGRSLGIAFQIRDDRLDGGEEHPLGEGAEAAALRHRDEALQALADLDPEPGAFAELRALGTFLTERDR